MSGRRAAGSTRAASATRRPCSGSTVRAAATSAWPATWPPNTRWRSSSGLSAAEDVDLDRLEVEEVDEVVERRSAHPSVVTAVMLTGTVPP